MRDDAIQRDPQIPVVSAKYESEPVLSRSWTEATRVLVLPLAPGIFSPGAPVALSIQVDGRAGRLLVHGHVGPVANGAQTALVEESDCDRLTKAISTLRSGPDAPLRQARFVTDELEVRVTNAGGIELVGKVRNVSDGGCFVATAADLPAVGSSLTLEASMANTFFSIRVKATVVRHDTGALRGFGVQFEEGQPDRVERFIYAALVTI